MTSAGTAAAHRERENALPRESGGARESRTWFPENRRQGLAPLIAASVLILTVLVIGLGARQTSTPAAPSNSASAAAPRASSIAAVVSEDAGLGTTTGAPATAAAAPLAEVLRLWGADPSSVSADAAGLTAVRMVTDLQTIARIDLPALVRFGGDEKALIEATPTNFVFVDPRATTPDRRVTVPRFSVEAAGVVDAHVFLPGNWAYPVNAWADPRLPALLDAGLRSLTPEGFPLRGGNAMNRLTGEQTRQSILRFQAAAGLPVDGVIGPITWCALVVRANPHYPRLAP